MAAQALSTAGVGLDPTAIDNEANREAVEAELARVLAHSTFKDTKRLKKFLEYVVTETLEGRGARLKGYSLGIEVFDRPDDFDPQGDTIVRVQAGQLRRRLDLYYAKDGLNNPVRILLPKGRYEPTFELRREQLKALNAPQETLRLLEGDRLVRPGILVPSIANLSGDSNYQYFAEGLTSEIVNALVQFRYLRIITGTPMVDSVTPMTNKDVASKFDAQFVLSGHVRRAKDVVRISVNLISAETGAHLLSKVFDRTCTPDNIFEIQEDIASYVAAAVATSNGAVNRYNRRINMGRRTSMRGYEALLKFFDARAERDDETFNELITEFDLILEANPKFSSGWAAQSLLYSSLVGRSYLDGDPQAAIDAALHTARRAISAHAENSLAYHASSMANFFASNFEQYESDAAQSISLNPNDYNVLYRYAQTRFCLGDLAGAEAFDNAAHELIALPAHWNMSVKNALRTVAGDYEHSCSQLGQLAPHSNAGTVMVTLAAAGHAAEHERLAPLKAKILERDPDYGIHIIEIFKRWHPSPDILEVMRSGLEKAGFSVK